jgi:hypothetical protein
LRGLPKVILSMAALPLKPHSWSFDPYDENGGTIVAISGADFSILAGDTRQSEGYNIQTRYAPRVFKLSVLTICRIQTSYNHACRNERVSVATCGFAADCQIFIKRLKQKLEVRVLPFPQPSTDPPNLISGTTMLMQRTCLFVPLVDWCIPCCMADDLCHTTPTSF